MEQQVNPYESGQAHQQGYVDPSAGVVVTPVALAALAGTKFWVTLVGFGMLAVVVLQVLVMLFVGANTGGIGSAPIFGIVLQVVMLVIYVVLAVRLLQYGKAIGRLSGSSDSADLERAMDVQSKFWRLLGILGVVMIVLMVISAISAAMFVNSATRF